jgi:hypothetical protein
MGGLPHVDVFDVVFASDFSVSFAVVFTDVDDVCFGFPLKL